MEFSFIQNWEADEAALYEARTQPYWAKILAGITVSVSVVLTVGGKYIYQRYQISGR